MKRNKETLECHNIYKTTELYTSHRLNNCLSSIFIPE